MLAPSPPRVPRRDTYTTGRVAKLLDVAPKTVTKWIDAGQLPGYRIPGSNDRRVRHDSLVAFCVANGLPLDLLGLEPAVLAVTSDPLVEAAVGRASRESGLAVRPASSWFAAGSQAAPDLAAAVLDAALGRAECLRAAAVLRAKAPKCKILVLAAEDESNPEAFLDAGASGVACRADDVAGAIRETLGEGRA